MPSSIKQRMSSQRRPWAHIYPLRSDGTPMLPHQIPSRTITSQESITTTDINNRQGGNTPVSPSVTQPNTVENQVFNHRVSPDLGNYPNNNTLAPRLSAQNVELVSQQSNLKLIPRYPLLRSTKTNTSTNIEESMLTMKTGVAWKSVTTPAAMPLTTDYYPQKTTMEQRFVCSSWYTLILEDIREQYGFTNYNFNKKTSVAQVFTELVGHRLAMGFQIVVPKNFFNYSNTSSSVSSSSNPTTNINSSSTCNNNYL